MPTLREQLIKLAYRNKKHRDALLNLVRIAEEEEQISVTSLAFLDRLQKEGERSLTAMQGPSTVQAVERLLAYLRALYMIHQNAHWLAKGVPYYGDHLLFQRLYETVSEEVDSVAERLVGVFGKDLQTDQQLTLMGHYVAELMPIEDHIARSYQAEQRFQALLQEAMATLEKENALTLGLSDLLPAIASTHETHLYLLSRRVRELG